MRLNKCVMGFPSPRHPGWGGDPRRSGDSGMGRAWRVEEGALTGAGVARGRGQHPSAHGLDVVGRRGSAHAGAALSGARPGQAAAGARGVGVQAVRPGRRVWAGSTGGRGAGAHQRTPLVRGPEPCHVVIHGRHLVQGQRLAAGSRGCQVHIHHHGPGPRGGRTA